MKLEELTVSLREVKKTCFMQTNRPNGEVNRQEFDEEEVHPALNENPTSNLAYRAWNVKKFGGREIEEEHQSGMDTPSAYRVRYNEGTFLNRNSSSPS